MGEFVDGLKFSGGSHSLMPKSFIKKVIDMAHQHDVYVSTGDWAEHILRKGPSAFKQYVEVILMLVAIIGCSCFLLARNVVIFNIV